MIGVSASDNDDGSSFAGPGWARHGTHRPPVSWRINDFRRLNLLLVLQSSPAGQLIVTPAERNWSTAAVVLSGATPAVSRVSTRVAKPAPAASAAVAATQ
ncbi:Uncharacterised protein [Mycolicibacterium smegmatis]|uniref:Uncharacterized protein n=1 Tax=Mycolicibacterium smegmatis TaxID=1772 RepID=A0A653FL35_MYCSM|nr:Uncharacterised protein [Mycolicibacterium smegmatis]VTP10423.1 hypothetical protein BIN_B_04765 [Mycolicibacterium smegmatis]